MIIKLFDYQGRVYEVDIGDIRKVARMTIQVLTGDEILHVIYKDYSDMEFDSSDTRTAGFVDGKYEIYDFRKSRNRLDDPKFIKRENPTEYLWSIDEG